MNYLLLAQVNSSVAYKSGYYGGQIVFAVLLLAGIWKCFSISRRPTTNKKCVHSLTCFLVTFLLAALMQPLIRAFPAGQSLISGIFGILFLIGLLAGIILAILGLVEYSARKPEFIQGRKQAISSLVISAVFLGIMAMGFIKGRANMRGLVTDQPRAGETLSFPELNYHYKAPAKPWVKIDGKKLNPFASLGMMRASPQVFFIVIAENAGGSLGSSELLEVCKGNLESAANKVDFVREFPQVRNQLHGYQLESEVQVNNLDISYVHWVCATNGYAYQLICWGSSRDKAKVKESAEELFSGFDLIDYTQLSSFTDKDATDFESTNFAYRVRMQNSSWQPWPLMEKQLPDADFAILNSKVQGAAMSVMALNLKGFDPSAESLKKAFLSALNISDSDEKLFEEKKVRQQDATGVELQFAREVDENEYTYRFRILNRKDLAYLVAIWVPSDAKVPNEFFESSFARVEFTDRDAYMSEPETFSETRKKRQAVLLNQLGIHYYIGKQFEKSLPYFQRAFKLDRESWTYLDNILNAQAQLGNFHDALTFLEQAPASVLRKNEIRALKARLQMQTDQREKPMETYSQLFADGFRNDEYFMDYLSLLNQAKQIDPALVAIETYLQKKDSATIRIWQSSFLQQKNQFSKAISILETQREKYPGNVQVGHGLVEAYLSANLEIEAVKLAEEMIQDGDNSYYVYYLKARSEFQLKRYKEAKASFEHALQRAPANKEIQAYVSLVSGLLGEGDNSSIKQPIAPVPVLKEFLNVSSAIPDEMKNSGACHQSHITAVSFDAGKEFKTTDYYFIKILDATGVSAFSTFRFVFDPLVEEIFVNELIVKGEDGKIISTGKVSNYYVLDENSPQIVSQKKILHAPVSGLVPGCTIQVVLTRRDISPQNTFRFFQRTFSRNFPVVESILFVRGDISTIRHKSIPAIESKRIDDGIYWRFEKPVPSRWEPLQPDVVDFLPTVWLGSNQTKWETEVEEYLKSIQDRMELDPEQTKLALKIIGKAQNDSVKIALIAEHIQTNYNYKALEFGRRAQIPQRISDIVHNKYGDCKDHALLLQQMLMAVGIPAHLALVSFDRPLQMEIPSLDQFNHMIVYLPSFKDGFFIDCTSKGSDLLQPVPLGLSGRRALILDRKTLRFVSIPTHTADASRISSFRHLQMAGQTDARIHETLSLEGCHAGYMRTYLKAFPSAMRKAIIQERLNIPSLEIEKLEIENMERNSSPLVLKISYLLKKQFRPVNDQIFGKMPAIWERFFLTVDPAENRATPFEVKSPLTFRSRIDIMPPDDWQFSNSEMFEQDFQHTFISCNTTAEKRDQAFKIEYQFQQPAGKYSKNQYPGYRHSLTKTIAILEQDIVFAKKNSSRASN